MCERKMTFGGICAALAICVGLTGAYAADTVIGQIEVKNGTAGAAGAAGADGLSAYQIWLNNNHTGSEADFLASLVGATGAAGQDGAPGCATTITKSKVGRTTTLTATDCNNNTVWTETVSDGTDGAAGQDGAPGCADEVDISDKNAQGCYTITKTPYSLVNGTCTAGTPDSKQVCDGANGTTPISCEATITMSDKDTSTGCYTITTQKRKANAANTSCVADGSAISKQVCDGADGTTPISCEATITMSDKDTSTGCYTISMQKRKANAAGTACENDGSAISKQVCDGATGATGATGPQGPAGVDGKDRCDDVAASDLATTEQNTKRVYVAQSGTTRGYTRVIVTYCDGNTTEIRELDSCAETPYDSVLTSCLTNQRHMDCKTPTNTSYSFCETGAGLNSEISKKLSTSDLGTALKENSVKTDLADAVAGSGALTGYLTSADASSTYATQTALNNADGKITALESTVGDSNSGLVKQVATNTSTIGNASGGLVKDVADAKTSAANAVSTANTASNNATQAKQDAASALDGLNDKLDKTVASSTYLSKNDATSTYLKKTDASSTYLTRNNASSTYATKSALSTVETTANNAANDASSALSAAQSAQTTASGHTSQINTLNTTVGIGTAGANSVLGRLGTVETTVNGTCSGTSISDGGNCTQGLQAQLTDLRNSYTTLQNNYSTLSANYTALQNRVAAVEQCATGCAAPKADQ